MDTDSIPLLCTMILLVAFSAFFSASETAFSSLNRIKIKNLAASGSKRAAHTLDILENYDRLLSSILVGNNIVNIMLASIGSVYFLRYFPHNGVAISTAVITVIVLIFGEVSPKSLAKESPEAFAMFASPLLRFFIVLLTPVNILFTGWKKLLLKLFKVKHSQSVTEEDLLTIVDEAESGGGIDEDESEMIRSAIEFNDLEVQSILTPRVDLIALPVDADKRRIMSCFVENGYSRVPVYEDTVDNIVGVINQKDFYEQVMYRGAEVSSIIGNVIHVTQTTKISDLLKILQKEKLHLAIVTDEYGGTAGIVTMEDILEELVGEIWDEHDEVKEEFQKISENEYRISCNANIDKMLDLLNVPGTTDMTTVSGWVMENIGRIPAEGDSFTYENLFITVTKTENNRVLEITVRVDPTSASEKENGSEEE